MNRVQAPAILDVVLRTLADQASGLMIAVFYRKVWQANKPQARPLQNLEQH